jgi:hypothetical protein
MNPKSGKAGKAVTPGVPDEVVEADNANPGKVAEAKAKQVKEKKGKYGTEKTKPFKPSEDEPKEGWIEIELVGEDDEPIAGAPYKVTLPDKSVAAGTLDQSGWARIEGFDPGGCKVSFPELDEEAWEFIESVAARPEED